MHKIGLELNCKKKMKDFLAVFKIFEDALEHVNFPQNEINELITDRKQKLKINCEKVGFLAQREFQKNLFLFLVLL